MLKFVVEPTQTLATILGIPFYRRMTAIISFVYLVLFMVAMQDITLGGRSFGFLTVEWTRMFDRTASVTFEPIARLTLPGLTILLSPVNLLIGSVISVLAGLNLMVSYIAFRQPKACGFNPGSGVLASLPAFFAGSACCAPVIFIILGLQMSSLFVAVFQVLLPAAFVLLVITLFWILNRTNPNLLNH